MYKPMLKPMLIGIGGLSASGKTTIAKTIISKLSDISEYLKRNLTATILYLDNYYNDQSDIPLEERKKRNYDIPGSLDDDLIHDDISALLKREKIEMCLYSFDDYTRKKETETKYSADIIIVEGILALCKIPNNKIYGLMDYKIYVETDINECLDRRIKRDTKERGRTPESVKNQWDKTVMPSFERYIRPSRDIADIIISGDDNNEEDIKRAMVKIKYFLINNQQDL